MAGTSTGAVKGAAVRIGVSVAEYERRTAKGQKWCRICKTWQPRAEFGSDATRRDGLTSACLLSKAGEQRKTYKPRPRVRRGFLVAARTGDKKQARRRVNYLVEQGLLPRPNTLPCVDCGHEWKEGERRHEYDHYAGYAAESQLRVEPVCTTCHGARDKKRRRRT